ncbi:hypothetical protein ASL20_30810 [Cupriavidus necator]|uniref:acyltransferase family protein n=1 Tax=Cupriavidus TaxID=106589 RepID=UPI00032FF22B|nr:MULTISPECIES: acyltransferase [Cupriavidus]EON18964.1 acyltransferase [Cupriavidus sp. GA3-3]KUE84996.1 hypothetical protein ASL20_30810 [Cupriavidus necator]
MRLAHVAGGRKDENNFNLMRITAALAVLVTHSYSLVSGDVNDEPLRRLIGVTPGTIAVDVFFVTSGFLVTKSLLTRGSVLEFLWARFLRIYPALLVMVTLVVFGLGMVFTALPASAYLIDPATRQFLLKTTTLVAGAVYPLPGVFAINPYPDTVNGSLWTMMYEIRMYFALAAIWVISMVAWHAHQRAFRAAVLVVTAASFLYCVFAILGGSAMQKTALPLMFFAGASLFILSAHVELSAPVAGLLLAAVVGSAFVPNHHVFALMYLLAMPYLVLFAAFVQLPALFRYNRLGDFSYGIYIYAFPIQQSIVALFPGISVMMLLLSSGVVTLALAVLSWHLVENRALKLKAPLVGATMRALGQAS